MVRAQCSCAAATQDVCACDPATANCVKKPCTITGVSPDQASAEDLAMCALSGNAEATYQAPVREGETWTFASNIPLVVGTGVEGGNFLSNVYLRLKSSGCSESELAAIRGSAAITKSDDGRVSVNTGSYALGSIDADDAAVRQCSSWTRVNAGVDAKLRASLDTYCPYWNDDINCVAGTRVQRPDGELPPGGYTLINGTLVLGTEQPQQVTTQGGNVPVGTTATQQQQATNSNGGSVIPISTNLADDNAAPSLLGRRSSALCAVAASAALMAQGRNEWPLPLLAGTAGLLFEQANAQGQCRVWLEVLVTDLAGVQVVVAQGGSQGARTLTFSTRNKSVRAPGEQ